MDPVLENLPAFWAGFRRTLEIIVYSAVGSLLLGTLIATCRISPVAPLRAFGAAYVTVVRNAPLTIVLFFFAFGLPEVGINADFFVFGVTGLVVYTSAFVCEALRSGINAVQPGQAEAARAIGLPFTGTLTQIVLPQAFRSVVPPLGSVIIAMMKNSAVVGAFGVGGDLFSQFRSLTSAQGYPTLPILLGVAVCFLLVTLPSGALLAWAERKVAIAR